MGTCGQRQHDYVEFVRQTWDPGARQADLLAVNSMLTNMQNSLKEWNVSVFGSVKQQLRIEPSCRKISSGRFGLCLDLDAKNPVTCPQEKIYIKKEVDARRGDRGVGQAGEL
jgi:hypothetical protein